MGFFFPLPPARSPPLPPPPLPPPRALACVTGADDSSLLRSPSPWQPFVASNARVVQPRRGAAGAVYRQGSGGGGESRKEPPVPHPEKRKAGESCGKELGAGAEGQKRRDFIILIKLYRRRL